MRALGWYSVPAAIAITGSDVETLALKAGIPESALESVDGGVDGLSRSDLRRLRAYLWRHGIFLVETPWLQGALRIAMVEDLSFWAVAAEEGFDRRHDGFAFAIFARFWRAWLRARGLGHRIGRRPAGEDDRDRGLVASDPPLSVTWPSDLQGPHDRRP